MTRNPRGFLLVEAMIAAVILSVAVAAVATLLVSAAEAAASGRQAAVAASLANQLMEEIAAKPLYPPTGTVVNGPVPTVRSLFTTAGQYANYTDTTAAIATAGGSTVSPGDGGVYRRAVEVSYQTGPISSLSPPTDFAIVTVTVTTPKGRTLSVSRLIGRVDLSMS
jgi:type II secretory pathway pseudopilin PulG